LLLAQIGLLTEYNVSKDYLEKLRCMKYYDEETDNDFEFLFNSFDISAGEIALL